MKGEGGAIASSPDGGDSSKLQTPKTVSDVIERLGLTYHHRFTLLFACWIYFFSGWATTLLTFLLDAAGQDDGAWVKLTSPAERLSISDRSFTLFGAGVVSALFNVLFGNLSDFIGRILVLQGSVVLSSCALIGFWVARQKLMLILLVFVTQMDVSVIIMQVLLAEWLPIYWRGFFIVSMNASWNAGRLGMTLLWAVLPPSEQWEAFFFWGAVFPVLMTIFVVTRGDKYESPRWLAVTGNMERCIEALKMAAASQPAESPRLPDGWDNNSNLQLEGDSGNAVQGGQRSALSQLAELREQKLQFLIVVLGFCFFSVSFAWSALFYWLMGYLRMLGATAAIVPVMMAAPIGKVASVVLLLAPFVPGQCIADRAPRALLMKCGFFGCGICVALLCYTTNVVALAAIIFSHNVLEGIIWTMGGLYATEAFPTTIRSSAIGVIGGIGTVGVIVSSAVVGELMEIWVYLPMVTASTLLFGGGLACFALTDEHGSKPLADTNGFSSTSGYGTYDDKSAEKSASSSA